MVAIPHGQNSKTVVFTNILTEKGRSIKLSPEHLIPVGQCQDDDKKYPLIAASSVMIGSCIMTVNGKDKVISLNTETDSGMYTGN